MTLVEIGTDEALASIEIDKLREFIASMKQNNGSFCVHKDGETDVRLKIKFYIYKFDKKII
jgi:prenyltransferase beta subunit